MPVKELRRYRLECDTPGCGQHLELWIKDGRVPTEENNAPPGWKVYRPLFGGSRCWCSACEMPADVQQVIRERAVRRLGSFGVDWGSNQHDIRAWGVSPLRYYWDQGRDAVYAVTQPPTGLLPADTPVVREETSNPGNPGD